MRSMWSGSITFGLVNIPIKLYSAVQSRRLDFDLLRKKDMCKVGYKRICKETGEEVDYKDLVRGFEYRKGEYVVLADEDFKKADVKKTNTVEIVSFVDEKEIPIEFFERPYYLEPDRGAAKVYTLLREALKKSKKVGVARFVLRSQEHLAIIKSQGNLLILNQIRFEHEIRKPDLEIPEWGVSDKEIDLALSLIDQLTEEKYDPSKYKDVYVEELMKIIEEKARGQAVKPRGEKPEPTQVSELMDKLKASLEEARTRPGFTSQAVH